MPLFSVVILIWDLRSEIWKFHILFLIERCCSTLMNLQNLIALTQEDNLWLQSSLYCPRICTLHWLAHQQDEGHHLSELEHPLRASTSLPAQWIPCLTSFQWTFLTWFSLLKNTHNFSGQLLQVQSAARIGKNVYVPRSFKPSVSFPFLGLTVSFNDLPTLGKLIYFSWLTVLHSWLSKTLF